MEGSSTCDISSRSAFLAAILFLLAGIATAQAPRSVTPVDDFELQSVKVGSDIAWRSDDALVVAAAWEGAVEVNLVTRKERRILASSGSRPQHGEGPAQSIWAAYRVATEGDLLVVSAPEGAFVWGWKDGEYHQMPFADARDYDLLDGQAFVVGVSGERGRWGSMNPPATMWSVLPRGDKAWVTPLRGGPEPRPLYHCTLTLNAAVARMPNGTVAVGRGFSPGVVLLDARGREIRTWATDGLSYQDRCDVSEEQGRAMGKDPALRFEWLNGRETLEDIIGTSHGPLLVIRQPRPGGTEWRGILLRFKGKPSPVSIPVKSASRHALLRASVRDSRVAFVISDYLFAPDFVALKTRIVIARLVP